MVAAFYSCPSHVCSLEIIPKSCLSQKTYQHVVATQRKEFAALHFLERLLREDTCLTGLRCFSLEIVDGCHITQLPFSFQRLLRSDSVTCFQRFACRQIFMRLVKSFRRFVRSRTMWRTFVAWNRVDTRVQGPQRTRRYAAGCVRDILGDVVQMGDHARLCSHGRVRLYHG